MRGISQPMSGRSQSGIARSGRPPAARSVFFANPATAPRRLPALVGAPLSNSSPSRSSSASPRALRASSHCRPSPPM